eukprot:801875-Pleurochrysis_carterae.AAC.1
MRRNLQHFAPVDAVDAGHFKVKGSGKRTATHARHTQHKHTNLLVTHQTLHNRTSSKQNAATQAPSSRAPHMMPAAVCTRWLWLTSSAESA